MANTQIDAELVIRLANFEKILNDIKKGLASVKLPEFKFSSQSAKDFTAFIRAVNQSGPQLQGAARNINTFAASIAGATAQLNKAAPGLRAMASALNSVSNHAKSAGQSTKFTTTMMEDLGRQTAITIRRFGGFLIARDLIFGITYGFRTAVVEAVKFEREMSKLAQLQNTTLEGTKELGRFIGELAVKFGASSSKLAESAQVLGQAGKRTSEIKTILKALGQASLTPTFGDLTKTTDSLLAVLGQFNLTGKDAAETLDVLNSVSKEFNVSVDELFEGVRRAGSTFAELSGVRAGVKPGIDALKEFAALFTAVIDTSRESAETIGTAFRTILPRLLRGETRELLKRELGLDLLDDEQKFIGPFKAIEKLFTGLRRFSGTDVGLTKIVEELGGSRQFNRVLPLILEFPKAQRALEIANRSSGSVAKDTAIAYDTLIVQLQQLKEQFLLLGRDLVDSGTFKALADGFVIAAKSAAVLVKALEPLLPLIGALAGASLFKGAFSFGKGFLLDNAFRMGPVRKASGGNINKVQSLLTPGELVLSPESARMNGQAALRRFNSTGDIGALKTLKGAQMVPGTGNTDSVPANLEPGSFVIRKQSVQKALGFKRFASGGRVGMADGGVLNDPQFRVALNEFSKEIGAAGGTIADLKRAVSQLSRSGIKDLGKAIDYLANRSISIQRRFLSQGGAEAAQLSLNRGSALFSSPASDLAGGGAGGGNLGKVLNSFGVNVASVSKSIKRNLAIDFTNELKRLGIASSEYRQELTNILKASKNVGDAQQRFANLLANDPRFIRGGNYQNAIPKGRFLAPNNENFPYPFSTRGRSLVSTEENFPFITRGRSLVPTGNDFILMGGVRSPSNRDRINSRPPLALPRPRITDPRYMLGYDPTATPYAYGTNNLLPPPNAYESPLITKSPRQIAIEQEITKRSKQLLLTYNPGVVPIPMGGPQSGPTIYAKSQGMIDFEDQLRSGQGVSRYSVLSSDNPGLQPSPASASKVPLSTRARGAYIESRRGIRRGFRRAGDFITQSKDRLSKLRESWNNLDTYGPDIRPTFREMMPNTQPVKDYLGKQGRAAYIQSQRGLLRAKSAIYGLKGRVFQDGRFTQGGAGALGGAAFGATIAGGAILSKTESQGGSILGGALSGAGIGGGIALSSSLNPVVGAIGAFGGAIVGAIGAVKSFNKTLEENKTRDVINQFVERGGSARNVAGRLDEVTTNLRQPSLIDRGFGNQLGYFGNARVAFNALSPAVTRQQAISDLTRKKVDAESNQIRQDFGPAAESLTAELQNNIIDRFKRGEKLDFNTLLGEVTTDQARTLAAGDVRFRSTDSVKDQTALGKSIAADAIRKQLEATKSAADLGAAIARLNRSTIELSTVFEAVDAKLRETDVFLGNFGTSVQRIMDPSNLVASQKFNVFSNVAGIPQSRVQGEVAAFEKQFGTGRTITGDSAILATQLKNELPKLLSSAQAQNPAADLQEVLQQQFRSANLLPAVRTNLDNAINALDTQILGDIDPQKIADEIYSRFAPSLKNMEKGVESSAQNDAARLAVMNQRTGLQGNIVDRNLSINALRNQSVDTRRSILNQFPTTPGEAQGRVLRDLQTLGAPGSPAEILNAISQVQEGGVTAEEAPQFNNLVKALDLLRGDTRVLDATMQKQNQLQQAAQGSRSFLERALSGPDEIAKINEEGADLRTIMQGGQVSGPRALAALRLGEQLNSSLTEEQVRAQFGTTKAEFTNNLSRSLAQQGLANFAPDSRGLGSLMGQNLLPSRDLANQAGAAIDTQVQAEQALRELDQKRVEDLNTILQTNAAGFNEAIQNAFTSQPVQEFKDTVKVLANSELKLGGKVDLIVTFTNKEAVTKDVQDAMKSAAIQVADERIAFALNQHTAKANAV